MKLKKIFAGMAASAIAMTTFAMGSAAPAVSADSTVSGNAGVTFQTDGNYTFRDITGTAGDHAVFPQKEVGCAGGANGYSTINANDTAISGSGTYTVSIPTSGKIDIEADLSKPANDKDGAWWVDKEKGVNRMGSKWDIRGAYEPPKSEDKDAPIPAVDDWELQAGNTKFNMLCVSTDIPCYYDADNHKCYLDEAMTQEVTVSDVSVDIPGVGTVKGGDAHWKEDVDTVCIALIDAYGDNNCTIDAASFPTDEGEISVTFTINFAEASESTADSTESGDSNASGSDSANSDASSNSSSSSSSSSKGGNGGGNGGGSTTKNTSTSESLADSASDATENAESGAPAGIALALAAVAGAVVVVSRKK